MDDVSSLMFSLICLVNPDASESNLTPAGVYMVVSLSVPLGCYRLNGSAGLWVGGVITMTGA